jgi:hypothetical protein
MDAEKIFNMPVAGVYQAYLKKVERKGGSEGDLVKVISWLTGFDSRTLKKHIKDETTFRNFFKSAKINPKAKLITGSICGVKIEEIEDPLMKKIRYMDKLVDELAKGRPMEKILRTAL